MRSRKLMGLLAAGLLMTAVSPALASAASPAQKFLHNVVKSKTVVWVLTANATIANGGENYDGYFRGKMIVSVPLGWTVKVVFKNVGSIPHSVVVEPWNENYNSPFPKPAFPRAESANAVDGTVPGSSQTFSFKATKVGKFRVICAVPGHAALGMWDTLVVSKGLKQAVWGMPPKAKPKAKAKPRKKGYVARKHA